MPSFLESVVGGFVADASVELSANVLPPVTLRAPSAAEGKPSWLMGLIRPRVVVYGAGGAQIATAAPYGDPRPPSWVLVALVVAGLLMALGALGYGLLRAFGLGGSKKTR